MKAAFCTCVQIGLSCLEALDKIGARMDLLISLKDEKSVKKSGRIYLNEFAEKRGIPLLKINHVNDQEVVDALKEHDIDWLFIIGWSQIANKEVISAPKLGAVGAHPTLLPKGRGRAAIPWAIIHGLDKTGVSFFKMDEGVDTGKILGQQIVPIEENETASTLYDKVNEAHETLITSLWPNLLNHTFELVTQDESQATYWEGRTPKDGELRSDMSVEEADRLIRATTRPYPGAFQVKGGFKYIIWSAEIVNDLQGEDILEFSNGFLKITESTKEAIKD
jgi:methionyl-tRNA formyltransferase